MSTEPTVRGPERSEFERIGQLIEPILPQKAMGRRIDAAEYARRLAQNGAQNQWFVADLGGLVVGTVRTDVIRLERAGELREVMRLENLIVEPESRRQI